MRFTGSKNLKSSGHFKLKLPLALECSRGVLHWQLESRIMQRGSLRLAARAGAGGCDAAAALPVAVAACHLRTSLVRLPA